MFNKGQIEMIRLCKTAQIDESLLEVEEELKKMPLIESNGAPLIYEQITYS